MDGNFSEIEKMIQSAVNSAIPELENKFKECHKRVVESSVYNAYEPIYGYNRRYSMYDDKNISISTSSSSNGFEITLTNTSTGTNGYSLDGIITYGAGYNWNGKVPPRDFLGDTLEAFESEAISILEKAISNI